MPFEFGRPLGAPNDARFQTKVLLAALNLFDASAGPVLADFSEEAPADGNGHSTLVCPVNFPTPVAEVNDSKQLAQVLLKEIRELRSWYDLAVQRNARTTVGASGLTIEDAAAFVAAFLDDEIPSSIREDIPPLPLFKLAIEDLKAYYLEAIAAQPGQQSISAKTIADWFWQETTAAKILFTIQDRWKNSENPQLQEFSRVRIVPRSRLADSPYR